MSKKNLIINERIAKRLSKSGVGSRRQCESYIIAGRVKINGKKIYSPALNVILKDKVEFDNKLVKRQNDLKVWSYYKPPGLIVSKNDDRGRKTIYQNLPKEFENILTVGRLDYHSEGLLLMTNDGYYKRKMELPSNNYIRRYKVKVKIKNKNFSENLFFKFMKPFILDGQKMKPMKIEVLNKDSNNAWLRIELKEGKYREIRRVLEKINLDVLRLIRISYGKFYLGNLKKGNYKEEKL